MKQCSVEYDPHVIKKLAKLDAPVRNQIKEWIDTNLEGCENPRLHGKALTGNLKEYWRYRVGGWRIMAKIQDDKVIIFVVKIEKRGDVHN